MPSSMSSEMLGNILSAQRTDPQAIAMEKEALDEALTAVQIACARKDPNAFIEFVMSDSQGVPLKQGAIHKEWQEIIPRKGPARVLIVGPRDHGKTEQMIGRLLWEIGNDPNILIKCVMGVDEKATATVGAISAHITGNPRVTQVFPSLRPGNKSSWTASKLYVQRDIISKDPTVEAASILSSGVSGRATLLLFDDVVNRKNAIMQPALQRHVIGQYREVWVNTLLPDGRIIYIATPWHEKDLTSLLLRENTFDVWYRPAIENGEAIWPEEWPLEKLERRRADIGERAFGQQYLLKVFADEERVFNLNAIDRCKDVTIAMGEDIDPSWPKYMGVDLARTPGGGDYTVIFVIAVDEDNRRHIVDITRTQVRALDATKLTYEKYLEHDPQLVLVENNQFQQMVVEQLTELDIAMPVRGHYTGRKKHDLDTGVPGLAAQIERGAWVIPFAGDHDGMMHQCPICTWIEEMLTYPVGEHDDTVMAMWLADTAARGVFYNKETFDLWSKVGKYGTISTTGGGTP